MNDTSPEMSVRAAWRMVIQNDYALSSSASNVGMMLSMHMTADGRSCRPPVRQLANETGLAPNTVTKAITELETEGYLSVRRGVGRGNASRYAPLFPERNVAAAATFNPSETSQSVDGNVATVATEAGDCKARKPSASTAPGAENDAGRSMCPERADALRDLVAGLDDSDGRTLAVWDKQFGDLPAAAFDHAAAEVDKRQARPNREPLGSPAGYACSILCTTAARRNWPGATLLKRLPLRCDCRECIRLIGEEYADLIGDEYAA